MRASVGKPAWRGFENNPFENRVGLERRGCGKQAERYAVAAATVLLVLAATAFAADPVPPVAPSIRLPTAPVVPTPPAPPLPSPLSPTVLTADLMYVIDSDVSCIILTSPAGLVDVSTDTGPIKIRGRFVDGSGKSETRSYTGKFVYTITAAATGKTELLIVPEGAKAEKDVIRRMLDCQLAPLPPPVPPTPPTPPDPPDPFQTTGDPAFRVLIVYESADLQKYPSTQVAALTSETWRKYVEGKGTWRCWDKDTDVTNAPAPFKKALAKAGTNLPFLLVGNGKTGYVGPMPVKLDDLMTLLKKFGG